MSMSLLQRVRQARAELEQRHADPWRGIIERGVLANVTSMSTVALLDLVGVRATTGNARRLAKTIDNAVAGVGRAQVATADAGWLAQHRRPRLGSPSSGAGPTAQS